MTSREDFTKGIGWYDEGQVLAAGVKSELHGQEAREKAIERGVDSLLNDSLPGRGSPRYTPDELGKLPEDQKAQKANEALSFRTRRGLADGIRTLKGDLEEVLKEGDGTWNSGLVKVAGTKPVVENINDPNQARAVGLYGSYQLYSDLINDLNAGRKPKVDEKHLREIASQAAYIKERDAMRTAGYSEELADLAGKLARHAPSERVDEEDIKRGAQGVVDEVRAQLTDEFGAQYEQVVAGATGEAIKRMIESGDEEDEVRAASLAYAGLKGYAPGERSYEEVFS